MKYKSIFISDVHLGTKFSQAEPLLDFMKEHESENFYLVGDIIDGWAMKRKFRWDQSHSDVIQKVLRKARKGTNVYFILGNHDEFLRPFIPMLLGDKLKILNKVDYHDLSGKRHFVTHGDYFDSVTMSKKWLAVVGDIGYGMLLQVNYGLNFLRKVLGIKRYWSLSKYVKDNVKQSVSFITGFEEILAKHAKKKGYDGIICGHIHKAEMRQINGVEYKNCGDWVESCTALVETMEGEWQIIDCLHHDT